MSSKPVAIVLGGTVPHVQLVLKLKARGYHVVLADYLDDPPARKFADEHVRISTLDKDAVLGLARQREASLVISACIDQANSTCCYVAEQLGLPHPYSYKTSLDVTDKGLMKRIMAENGIPTSAFQVVKGVEEVVWRDVEFPAVVKPVDCNSSKGVRRVDCREDAEGRISEALSMSRAGRAIIEGFNEGLEIQVDCVAGKEGAEVLLTRQKQKVSSRAGSCVLQSYGSVFPARLDDASLRQVRDIAAKIALSFGLRNTPFFFQAVLTADGVKVLEFAPRVGGGLSDFMIRELTAFDPIEAVVESFLGHDLPAVAARSGRVMATCLVYARSGVLDHVEGLSELKQAGTVKEIFVYKERGAELDGDMRSSNRVASFVVEDSSVEGVLKKERDALRRIEVYDISGRKMLKRDSYGVLQD